MPDEFIIPIVVLLVIVAFMAILAFLFTRNRDLNGVQEITKRQRVDLETRRLANEKDYQARVDKANKKLRERRDYRSYTEKERAYWMKHYRPRMKLRMMMQEEGT